MIGWVIMTMLHFAIMNFVAESSVIQSPEQKRESVSFGQWAYKLGLIQNPDEELTNRFIKQNYADYLNWCAENSFDPVFISFFYNE